MSELSRLDEVQQRCENATTGPWWNDIALSDGESWVVLNGKRCICLADEHGFGDTNFIAAARTDLPDLARDFRTVAEELRTGVMGGWMDNDDAGIARMNAALDVADAWLGVPHE